MLFRNLSQWQGIITLTLLVFSGCAAAYQPPPLTAQHPANPEAMAAPESPASKTLDYGTSDSPSPQPAGNRAQYEMKHDMKGMHGSQPAKGESRQTVVGEGKVVAIPPGSNQIVVDHKEIKGFMGAMAMGYPVDPPSLLEGVKIGDMIRFTIDTKRNTIIKIEKVNP